MITPYEKITIKELWTTPYIAKNMLEYHLNSEHDIASKRICKIEKTVDFIIRRYHPSSICDFGCGPGLYTDLFAQKGLKTYGIDFSPISLDYAKENNTAVTYLQQDYTKETFNKKVDMITLFMYDFAAIHPTDQINVLSNIYNSLHDKGHFALEVHNQSYFDIVQEQYNHYEETDGFYMKGPATIAHQTIKYEKMGLVLEHITVKGKEEYDFYNWNKTYKLHELAALLRENGFIIEEVFTSSNGTYMENSHDYFVVCKKKQSD